MYYDYYNPGSDMVGMLISCFTCCVVPLVILGGIAFLIYYLVKKNKQTTPVQKPAVSEPETSGTVVEATNVEPVPEVTENKEVPVSTESNDSGESKA